MVTRSDTSIVRRPLEDLQSRQAVRKEEERFAAKQERQAGIDAQQSELREEQIAGEKLKNLNARQQARLTSSIQGSAQLNTFLEANDLEGAKRFLQQRKVDLGGRIAAGEDVDTTETDQALAMLENNPGQLKDLTRQSIIFGQRAGILEATGTAGKGGVKGGVIDRLMQEDPSLSFKDALFMTQTGRGAKPPTGFRPTAEGDLEAIPGGPVDIKQKEKQEAKIAAVRRSLGQADVVIGKVDEALAFIEDKSTGLDPTGLLGQVGKFIGGTDAFNLNKMVETVQANLGFDQLQALRDASPTGGALGQVSERELSALQATLASLDIGQSTDILIANLKQIKVHYNKLIANIKAGQARDKKGQAEETTDEDSGVIDFNDLPG